MGELVIGYHVTKGAHRTYAAACEHAHKVVREYLPSANPCAAIFSSGPRTPRPNLDTKELAALADYAMSAPDTRFVMHSSYTDLLCVGAKPSATNAKRITTIARKIGGVIPHARARLVVHATREFFAPRETCAPIYEILAQARDDGVPILIETMSAIREFASPRAINIALDAAREIAPNIGLCIDTAHIWAAGADIATRASCADWFGELARSAAFAVHLNDSTQPRGTGRDIHTTLGSGEIWSLEDGYMSVIEWARARSVPLILERTRNPEAEARVDLRMLARKLN